MPNFKNPVVNEVIDSRQSLLSISESVTYERTLERRVEFAPEEIRIVAVQISAQLLGGDTTESLIRDAALIERYIVEGL